ncbi:hypothetical protein SASPL_117484 [Salvia splendens]|uniref:chorismate mutase n=1 Tax=Salvia splendens TaxID=180675 RepID=A0A8X8XVK1_SALSN|nr:hypothetical protein SASPL_117484 [Salvia splendens]
MLIQVLHSAADVININVQVWNMYFRNLLPGLVKEGDDGNYGSTALLDALCLQVRVANWSTLNLWTLSKRINYGKFVAETKFQASPPEVYKAAIRAKDGGQLMDLLTYETVEDTVNKRVELKTRNIVGVGELYRKWIMPLTKQVQVEYLLRRLDLVLG